MLDDVLGAYRDLTESAARELTAAVNMRLAPPAPFLPEEWHGKLVAEKPSTDQQSMLDGMEPKGNYYYWKTEYLPGLSNEFLDTLRDSALRVTSPLSESIVIHIAGALNERADDDGAVGKRDARYMIAFAGQWPADAPDDTHVAWVREAWERVRAFSTGGNYLNFQTADEEKRRLRATYGVNYDRLVEVKETYDPDNLFHSNRNIGPRARFGKAGPT